MKFFSVDADTNRLNSISFDGLVVSILDDVDDDDDDDEDDEDEEDEEGNDEVGAK